MPQTIPYPMTTEQMAAWAKEVSGYTAADCHRALHDINARRVTITRLN